MFTGKRPTSEMFKEGLNLHNFVKATLSGKMDEILDHALFEDIDGEETSSVGAHNLKRTSNGKLILRVSTSILEIALSCSSELPQERLNMRDVAVKLCSMRDELQ